MSETTDTVLYSPINGDHPINGVHFAAHRGSRRYTSFNVFHTSIKQTPGQPHINGGHGLTNASVNSNGQADRSRFVDLAALMKENARLEKELIARDQHVIELQNYISEQSDELIRIRKQAARLELDTERFRVENSVLNDSTNFDRLIVLEEEKADAERTINELSSKVLEGNQEISELKLFLQQCMAGDELSIDEKCDMVFNQPSNTIPIRRAEEISVDLIPNQHMDRDRREVATTTNEQLVPDCDCIIDSRAKSELLGVIRRLKDEKSAWETYANSLLRRIVTTSPNIIELCTPYREPHPRGSARQYPSPAKDVPPRPIANPNVRRAQTNVGVVRRDQIGMVDRKRNSIPNITTK